MLEWVMTLGAVTASGVVGSIEVGGYVPPACRAPEAASSLPLDPTPRSAGGACSLASIVTVESDEPGQPGITVTRITYTPR